MAVRSTQPLARTQMARTRLVVVRTRFQLAMVPSSALLGLSVTGETA